MDLIEMNVQERVFELHGWLGRKVSLQLGYYIDETYVAGIVRAFTTVHGDPVLVLLTQDDDVQVIPVEDIYRVERKTW